MFLNPRRLQPLSLIRNDAFSDIGRCSKPHRDRFFIGNAEQAVGVTRLAEHEALLSDVALQGPQVLIAVLQNDINGLLANGSLAICLLIEIVTS